MCERAFPLRKEAWRAYKASIAFDIPGDAPRPTQRDFDTLARESRRVLSGVTDRLASGAISVDEFGDQVYTVLVEYHARSVAIGRQLAGNSMPLNSFDRLIGVAAADDESRFLAGFLSDLRGRRYFDDDDQLKSGSVMNRLNLYTHKFRGTANEAFMLTSSPLDLFTWHLGPNDHCADCPQIAALSPFSRDANLGYPGDGGTECLTNCTCYLTRDSDGVRGFTRVD